MDLLGFAAIGSISQRTGKLSAGLGPCWGPVIPSSRRFELTWNQYIAYGVTNESFGSATGTEAPDSARLLRVYIESPFLDFVARSTPATKQYPGPYTHVRVLSENHIVDVVSTVLPVLRIVAPS